MTERITFVVSSEQKKSFVSAAEKDGLDLSNWIRFNLITAARPHMPVGRPSKKVYKWNKEDVTQEVYEANMARMKKRNEDLAREISGVPADVAAEMEALDRKEEA